MRIALSSLAVLLALGPATAWAQAGWYVTSSLRLTEEFDDNILGSSSKQRADWITRLSDSLSAGYRSTPLTFLVSSTVNAEAFANNPDRDGVNGIQAGLDFQYIPTRPLTLRLNASATQTQTPSDLVQALGLELGRHASRQLGASPSLSYRFSPQTSSEVGYSYTQSESQGVTNATHAPRLSLSHQLTRVDVGTVAYAVNLTESAQESLRSDVMTLGWTRRLSATTSLTLSGGPRISEGKLDAEINGGLSHRLRQGDITLGYARSETTIVGETGRATTQSLSGALSLEPLKSVRVAFASTLGQVSRERGDTTAQALDVTVSYRILKWLSATFRYHFGRSETQGTAIYHNTVSVGLDASYPVRVE